MYKSISTINDVTKEKYILGAKLTVLGFPVLEPVHAKITGIRPVPFQDAGREKRPKECIAHFFTDDYRFERIWNNCEKYLDILKNFKYACSPDFSCYSNMPYVMQLWQIYRSRALSHFLSMNGISVIPTATWSGESSFDFCFDGLPQNSTLVVSTNGCFTEQGKTCYRRGFEEMCKRLNPYNVLVVGREIHVDADTEIIYFDSFGQDMSKRLGGRVNGR